MRTCAGSAAATRRCCVWKRRAEQRSSAGAQQQANSSGNPHCTAGVEEQHWKGKAKQGLQGTEGPQPVNTPREAPENQWYVAQQTTLWVQHQSGEGEHASTHKSLHKNRAGHGPPGPQEPEPPQSSFPGAKNCAVEGTREVPWPFSPARSFWYVIGMTGSAGLGTVACPAVSRGGSERFMLSACGAPVECMAAVGAVMLGRRKRWSPSGSGGRADVA